MATRTVRGYPCGCYANTGMYAPDQETPQIDWCPLHAVAPAMLEALKDLLRITFKNSSVPEVKQAIATIAAAEGRG